MTYIDFADMATDMNCVMWHSNGFIHFLKLIQIDPKLNNNDQNDHNKRIKIKITYDIYFKNKKVIYFENQNIDVKKLFLLKLKIPNKMEPII